MEFESHKARLAAYFKLDPSGGPGLSLGPNADFKLSDVAAFITEVLDSSALLEMLGTGPAASATAEAAPFSLPLDHLSVDALTLIPPTDDEPYQITLELVWKKEASAAVDTLADLGMTFSLREIRAAVDIAGPKINVVLTAKMDFDALELELAAQLPAGVFEATLGPCGPEKLQAQQDLVKRLGPAIESSTPPAPSAGSAGGLRLNALNLMFIPRQRSVLLHFAVDDLFTLQPFTLKEVQADMVYSAGRKSGRLWTELEIAMGAGKPPVIVLLGAELDPSGGWKFAGRSGPGGVPLGELLQALGGSGSVALPRALSTLDIAALALAYDTGSKTFDFAIEVQLTVEGTAVDVTVCLSLQSGAAHTTDLKATVHVGAQEFDLDFAKTSEHKADGDDWESALVALYKCDAKDQSKQPNLHAMVEPLSPALACVVPSITVPKAIFGYHSQKKAGITDSAWLFGVELGFDINFGLGDLPVVSSLFGKDLSFGVEAVQVLLASHPMGPDVLGQMPHLDEFSLPQAELKKACISATMRLGAYPYPLMLNLGAAPIPSPAGVDAALSPPAAPAHAVAVPTPAIAPADAPVDAPADASATAAVADDGYTWISVQKQVSVLYVDKIGVRYHDGNIGLAVGAALTASGLTITLNGLGIATPLKKFAPHFSLSGLGIAYNGGPVEISGAFLEREVNGVVQYSGEALVKAATFTLSAIGSYASVQGSPSLFIFTFLDKPLGGPGFFFVTGVAAGFGYNRSLRIPTIDQVSAFPLISAVTAAQAGSNPFKSDDPAQALSLLDDFIAPASGENWLAIGVRFTSFKVVQSFALITVTFGSSVELSLLGLSTMTMPAELPAGQEPVGYAQLALRVTYSPDRGVFSAAAQLTSESYILSKACHLTGGFALCIWFKEDQGARAGEFVLTLGGYHPRYVKPAHYPDAPPIGFNWQIDNLTIKGGMYFALTPSAVMAGGYLDAVWQSGGIRAWFQAYADFLLAWKPFHYDVSVGLSLGASFEVDLLFTSFTLTIHVGVDLTLWGPPFGGTATVDLSVISFTIPFGKDPAPRPALKWAEFKASFLPTQVSAASTPAPPLVSVAADLPAAYKGATATDSYCYARVASGLASSPGDKATAHPDAIAWVVNGSAFELVVQSVIPARKCKIWIDGWAQSIWLHDWLDFQVWLFVQPEFDTWLNDPEQARQIPKEKFETWKRSHGTKDPAWNIEVGPVDVAAADFSSELFVAVNRLHGIDHGFLEHVKVQALHANVPSSIWSVAAAMHTSGDSISALNADPPSSVLPALSGLSFKPHIVSDKTPLPIDVDVLQDEIEEVDPLAFWSAPKAQRAQRDAGSAACSAKTDPLAIVALLARQLALDPTAAPTPSHLEAMRHAPQSRPLGDWL